MLFPQLTQFHPKLKSKILEKRGNNQLVSQLIPWIRVSASTGLVIESTPDVDSFDIRYGNNTKSGRVGTDFAGNAVFVESDRGFRPSPIIEGLGVTFSAGGLSRKCSFAIKCFTLAQAEKVCEYFLEPGYTVMVEYGWNTKESVQSKIDLNPCEIAKFNSYEHVKKKHMDSNFTYDGFMGYITNGGFKSTEGETYTIEIELTSLGDVAMYLQQHRGGGDKQSKNTGGLSYDTGLIDDTSESNLGYSLWMQMFNRLPIQKQTKEVRALVSQYDDRGNPWINSENFINMDETILSDFNEALKGATVQTDTATQKDADGDSTEAQIPDDVDFFSKHSYIRLALAFEILNTYSLNLYSVPSECAGLGTYNAIIEYKNTIIRATKYMFSHDGSKLFIPNPLTPDFGLVHALSSVTKESAYPILDASGVPTRTANLQQWKESEYQFPQQINLRGDSKHKWPMDVLPFNAGPGEWGYLKDLYINFEFFCEVLGRANYVSRDVYYELLNGISSAANSIWHFDIKQLPSINEVNKNQYHMEVVDMNFCGKIDKSTIVTKFRASGAYSPFLESTFSMDIPGAMKSMIVAERMAGASTDVVQEGNLPVKTGTLFATKQDPVINMLNSIKKRGEALEAALEGSTTDVQENKAEPPSEDEIRKQNYELFMSKATVIPSIKDRNLGPDVVKSKLASFFTAGLSDGADSSLDALVYIGAWSDPSLFRTLDLNNQTSTTANNVLLDLTFDFKIHGVAGIKTGDLFEIEDLPNKYKDNVFQVVEVSHGVDSNMWTTSVKGKMRRKG